MAIRFKSTPLAIVIAFSVTAGAVADDRPMNAKITPPDRVIQAPAGWVGRIAFSPDGKFLAAASGVWKQPEGVRQVDVKLQLFEVDSGKEIRRFEGHTDRIISLGFSPNGKRLVSASDDKTVRVWDVGTGRREVGFNCNATSMGGAAFVDDKSIAVSQEAIVYFFNVTTGEQNRRPLRHPTSVGAMALSPDGTHLIAGCGNVWFRRPPAPDIANDCRIHVWNIAAGSEVQQFAVGTTWVRSVAFSPDGKWALSGSGYSGVQYGRFCKDCFVRLWDIKLATPARRFEGHTEGVASVTFTPDSRFAVSGSSDHTIRLWELATGKEFSRFNLEGVNEEFSFKGLVGQVVCSPDGKFIVACASDPTIRFWRMPNPK